MMREEGFVIARDGHYATVSTVRGASCGACQSKGSCSTGSSAKEIRFRALNRIEAEVGERVVLEIAEGNFLKASFLVYIAPLIAMLVIAAMVNTLLLQVGMAEKMVEGLTLLSGVVTLAVFFWLLKKYNRYIEQKGLFLPVIAKVLGCE